MLKNFPINNYLYSIILKFAWNLHIKYALPSRGIIIGIPLKGD